MVRQNPHDVNAAVLLARIAIQANCYEDAEALLRKVVEHTPRFIEAWHDLSTALKEQSKHTEAVEVLDRALEKYPNSDVLRDQHKVLLKQHLRRVRRLDAEALLVRAQLLYNKLPVGEYTEKN